MITLIAAVARGGAIGRQGQLLWHIPEDLKHFKETTMGAPVVMGRNTWESLPFRPLPGRLNIVVSRNEAYMPHNAKGVDVSDKVTVFTDLEEALRAAEEAADRKGTEAFVIGGGKIYAATIDRADALELTEIDADAPDADTFFPPIETQRWEKTAESEMQGKTISGAGPAFRFVRYERKR